VSERQAFTEAWEESHNYWGALLAFVWLFLFFTFTLASLKEKMQAKLDQLSGCGNSVYYY
jgi:hypothetical protein